MIHYNKGPNIDTIAFKQSPRNIQMHVAILECTALPLGYEEGNEAATGLKYKSDQYTIMWSIQFNVQDPKISCYRRILTRENYQGNLVNIVNPSYLSGTTELLL